jgi:hypothetical protein
MLDTRRGPACSTLLLQFPQVIYKIERTIYPTVPPRVEYEVTPLGQSLREILKNMCHWSSENMEKVHDHRRTRQLEPADN